MLTKIQDDELLLVECLTYSISSAECLFNSLEDFSFSKEDTLANVRLSQYPLLSYEYVLDEDPDLSTKENFQLREGAGNIDCFGGRLFGKTLITELLDILVSIFNLENQEVGFSSVDHIHIRAILEDKLIPILERHPFFKIYQAQINRSPNYRIALKNGYILIGINMNLLSRKPGDQFFGRHLKRLYIEEACVDGHTKIRYLDSNNNIKTKNISELINSGEYKNISLFTYNLDKKIIETKKVNKIFKKQVKNCEVYEIKIDKNTGSNNRTLKVSENHRLFVNNGYKTPKEIKVGDNMYLLDECELSQIQKEILVGCLLGDSHLNKKRSGCSLSFTNSNKQLEFLKYKKNCFNEFFDTYRKTKNSRHSKKEIKSWGDIARFTTKEQTSFYEFKDFKYCKVKNFYSKVNKELLYKYLTPISLAFFIMDDGSIGSYNCKTMNKVNNYIYLHTEAFDLETQDIILKCLQEKFNIFGTICNSKNYYYIAFDSKNSEKIINLIKDYIHPSMLYKVNIKNNNFKDLSSKQTILKSTKITSIKKKTLKSWTMYCFGVEDNHNFFANSILTGNSFETEEVYNKRIDARSEFGCVTRSAGMTNFTKYSPVGRRFYDAKNRAWVCNLPQYCNPLWDDKQKQKAIEKHGGENAVGYRIYVKGEVTEDNISVFDMSRIRIHYLNEKQQIKKFEITKQNFINFRELLVLDRPSSVEQVYIDADIGESAPTEIIINFKTGTLYKYEYNITLYNLLDNQQVEIFKYLINKLGANSFGLDCTDGTGRSIFRAVNEFFPGSQMNFCSFSDKLPVGFEKDEVTQQLILDNNGKPILKEEFVSEWSIKVLKDLLYEPKLLLPIDYKLDKQLNSVVSTQTLNRIVYSVVGDEDHLLAAFRVFAISHWSNEFKNLKPINQKKFHKGVV